MKKKIIALVVAAAMVPAIVAAEGASVSGYNIIKLKADDDNNKFSAETEINFRSTTGAVTVGADVDFSLAPAGGSANLEQAFFAYTATENLTIIGGLFNNPIGMEGEDATEWATTQRTLVGSTLDAVTVAQGNNVAGLAAAYNAGVATVTVALLNSNTANDDADTIALVINASPVEGLDLEFGHLSEGTDGGGNTGGAATDLNATYAMGSATVSFEYLTADVFTDDIVALSGGFKINDETKVAARFETQGDVENISLAAWYKLEKNLTVGAGYNSNDDGMTTDDNIIVKFKATF